MAGSWNVGEGTGSRLIEENVVSGKAPREIPGGRYCRIEAMPTKKLATAANCACVLVAYACALKKYNYRIE